MLSTKRRASNNNSRRDLSPNFSQLNEIYRNNQALQYSLNSSMEFYKDDGTKRKKLKRRYFICDYCFTSPKFSFIINKLHVKCDCKKLDQLLISDFIEKYTTHDKNVIEEYLCCKNHGRKYEYYCKYCRVNLCKDCMLDDVHKNHYPEKLLDENIEKVINQIKDLIKKIRKKVSVGDIENRKILNIILTLIKNYKEYPCHNLHKSITDFLKYLENLDIPRIKTQIKIISKNQLLEENISEISQYITSIKINGENFHDLGILSKLDLSNLKKLSLIGNNITNIEPLLKINFEKLEYLDLENNKIDDENFKNFSKMKFKNIRHINLFENRIKSPTIFECVKHFPSLKTYFVGKNLFDQKEIKNNINKMYDLSHIKKIGLTGNFTDRTINFISNLKLDNLEVLYISRNKLSSLDCLKKICCKRLIAFWAITNNLKDFKGVLNLKYKEKIEEIVLKENQISNIDDLSEFIEQFPNLKLFNISDNYIDLDDPKNKKIINQIKNKYKNCKFYFTEENN